MPIFSSKASFTSGIIIGAKNSKPSKTQSWKIDCPIICFNIVFVTNRYSGELGVWFNN